MVSVARVGLRMGRFEISQSHVSNGKSIEKRRGGSTLKATELSWPDEGCQVRLPVAMLATLAMASRGIPR